MGHFYFYFFISNDKHPIYSFYQFILKKKKNKKEPYSCRRPPLYDTQAYIFTWLLLQAYLSITHTVCKHVKATHTYMYRRFEHVLSKLGRVEKTERLIIYLNKLN